MKNPSKRCSKTITWLLLLTLVPSCTPTVVHHGHRLTEENISQIQPGQSRQQDVLRLLGSPSATATFGQNKWYYVTQKRERRSFYQAEIKQQDVLSFTFDEGGIVQQVDIHDLAEAQDIKPSEDKTKTQGKELTVLEQFLGNIGRFSTPDN